MGDSLIQAEKNPLARGSGDAGSSPDLPLTCLCGSPMQLKSSRVSDGGNTVPPPKSGPVVGLKCGHGCESPFSHSGPSGVRSLNELEGMNEGDLL